jgi:ATPase subunit of ABC transporter with duplicated ATPase domains
MTTHNKITIQNLSYTLPNGDDLFANLKATLGCNKIGLVGRNGIGKTTLLKLICGDLTPSSGSIIKNCTLGYLPQNSKYHDNDTIADILGIKAKLQALERINNGSIGTRDYEILNDDWDITERIHKQLDAHQLQHLNLDHPFNNLSGGEQTKIHLIKLQLDKPDFLLLDEPSNNLDHDAREHLYKFISSWPQGLLVISHDRELLNHMDETLELSGLGLKLYGGNYAFYSSQKTIELNAATQDFENAKQQIKKTEQAIQEKREKHAQHAQKGKKLRRDGSVLKMTADSMKGRSEKTNKRLKTLDADRTQGARNQLNEAKAKIDQYQIMELDLSATNVPAAKKILEVTNLYFQYDQPLLQNINFTLVGPERAALIGPNGSGKSTLIKLILGDLKPQQGEIKCGAVCYLDQQVNLLNDNQTLLGNYQRLNPATELSQARQNLAHFLFRHDKQLQIVQQLSGGERLRAGLACTLMGDNPPQLLILDEPTNHMDLDAINSLEQALNSYQGALLVVSHDRHFLENIGVQTTVRLTD